MQQSTPKIRHRRGARGSATVLVREWLVLLLAMETLLRCLLLPGVAIVGSSGAVNGAAGAAARPRLGHLTLQFRHVPLPLLQLPAELHTNRITHTPGTTKARRQVRNPATLHAVP